MPYSRESRQPGPRIVLVGRAMATVNLMLIVCIAMNTPTNVAGAQGSANPALARVDTLASRGDSAGARMAVDSILADTDPTAPIYPGALFRRGVLASSPADARKDLLRLIVDYPFSERVGDALYRLALDEMATGDQSNARQHLTRFVRDHAASQYGSAGAFQLGKILMADGEVLAACAALDSALAHEPAGNIELRNQISYVQRPCDRARANAAVAARGGPTTADPPKSDSSAAGRPSTDSRAPARTSAPARRWSVQVAALGVRADATALAERLKSRGYDSRVVPGSLFRVRIGRFATQAEATRIVAKLKAENTTAIVVEAERP